MLNLEQIVTAVALVGVRVSGLMLFAPFFNSVSVPIRVKAGLVLLLIWLLAPSVGAGHANWLTPSAWASIAFNELAVGMLLGLSVQFVFEASQFAAQMLGAQLGFSLVHLLDPQSQADTAVLGLFQETLVLLLFLALDLPNHLLRALMSSFSLLPPGTFSLSGSAVRQLLEQSGTLFVLGIRIAAPVLAATMLADIALGFLGKASPQLPVLFVGLSLKNVLGLTLLCAVLWTWPQSFSSAFATALARGERLLSLCRLGA